MAEEGVSRGNTGEERDVQFRIDVHLNPRDTSSEQSTSADVEDKNKDDCFKPPPAKKPCLDVPSTSEDKTKLEVRLGGILCCAVCLDLPRNSVFQVSVALISHIKLYKQLYELGD